MRSFFGSIFINRDELREAGIEYPIKVEYYKITNDQENNKLIYGIQVVKTEYKEKIGVEQSKVEYITNNEKDIERMLEQIKENEVTPVGLEDVVIEIEEKFNSWFKQWYRKFLYHIKCKKLSSWKHLSKIKK